jgi:pimeloyl-ACP methyl ester carboxylesterase
VAGLLLVNPVAHVADAARKIARERAEIVRTHGIPGLLPSAVDMAFHQMPRDEKYFRYEEQFRLNDPLGYEYSLLGLLDADVRDCLPTISVPTRVVVGTCDVLHPPAVARDIATKIKNATYAEIEGAAHFPSCQQPRLFLEEAWKLLRAVG